MSDKDKALAILESLPQGWEWGVKIYKDNDGELYRDYSDPYAMPLAAYPDSHAYESLVSVFEPVEANIDAEIEKRIEALRLSMPLLAEVLALIYLKTKGATP